MDNTFLNIFSMIKFIEKEIPLSSVNIYSIYNTLQINIKRMENREVYTFTFAIDEKMIRGGGLTP